MPGIVGFVDSVGVESEAPDRLWFNLTDRPGGEWIRVGAHRAWFVLDLDALEDPGAQMLRTVLLEAAQTRRPLEVQCGPPLLFNWLHPGDSFVVTDLRPPVIPPRAA